MRLTTCLLTSISLLAAACATDPIHEDPGAGFADGKADEYLPPLEATLDLSQPTVTTVWFTDSTDTAVELVYVELSLSGPATVSFETQHSSDPHAGIDAVDTALYLYQPQNGVWGSYLAADDDGGDAPYSKLTAHLDAGSYRLLLQARHATGIPIVDLVAHCNGAGCAPSPDQVPPARTYDLVLDHPNVTEIQFVDSTDTVVGRVYSELTLSGPALVTFRTMHSSDPHAGSGDVDTVLALYHPQNGTWGTPIAYDDDGGPAPYSLLSTILDAGTYRLMFQAVNATGIPIVDVSVECYGGCGAPSGN